MMDQERAQLINLAAHQLGTPISVMRWWLEIMRDKDHPENINTPEVQQNLQSQIERMSHIVGVLNRAGQLHNCPIESIPVDTDIYALCAEVVEQVLQEHPSQSRDIDVQVDPSANTMFVDSQLLHEVLRELLNNAIVYSDDGTKISVSAKKRGKSIDIRIQDEGCGVLHEDRDRIFDRFTRGKNAVAKAPDGNGLGLYFARRTAAAMGGTLTIEKSSSRGTLVRIRIPVV